MTGQPEYLDTDAAVASFFSRTGPVSRVAVDTEGASFHKFVDRIYLIQLSTADRHAIIDPLPIKSLELQGSLSSERSVSSSINDQDLPFTFRKSASSSVVATKAQITADFALRASYSEGFYPGFAWQGHHAPFRS